MHCFKIEFGVASALRGDFEPEARLYKFIGGGHRPPLQGKRHSVEAVVVDLEHVHPAAGPIAVWREEEGPLRGVVLQR